MSVALTVEALIADTTVMFGDHTNPIPVVRVEPQRGRHWRADVNHDDDAIDWPMVDLDATPGREPLAVWLLYVPAVVLILLGCAIGSTTSGVLYALHARVPMALLAALGFAAVLAFAIWWDRNEHHFHLHRPVQRGHRA